MDKFRRDHGNNALPTLQSFWEDFYQEDGVADEGRPQTMLHVKDIVHRWILHVNKLSSFVQERDNMLSEVTQYLKARLSDPCYRAWQMRKGDCNDANMRYMLDLLAFAHNLQWFLIRKPLLGIGAKEPSNAGFARYLFAMRHERGKIQIDQKE